jgi:hypothetical protein
MKPNVQTRGVRLQPSPESIIRLMPSIAKGPWIEPSNHQAIGSLAGGVAESLSDRKDPE